MDGTQRRQLDVLDAGNTSPRCSGGGNHPGGEIAGPTLSPHRTWPTPAPPRGPYAIDLSLGIAYEVSDPFNSLLGSTESTGPGGSRVPSRVALPGYVTARQYEFEHCSPPTATRARGGPRHHARRRTVSSTLQPPRVGLQPQRWDAPQMRPAYGGSRPLEFVAARISRRSRWNSFETLSASLVDRAKSRTLCRSRRRP